MAHIKLQVALADSVMLLVAGLACGGALLAHPHAPFAATSPCKRGNGSNGTSQFEHSESLRRYSPPNRTEIQPAESFDGEAVRSNLEEGKNDFHRREMESVSGHSARENGERIGVDAEAEMANARMPTLLAHSVAFGEIASWTAGVLSYGYMGINRFQNSKKKEKINQNLVASPSASTAPGQNSSTKFGWLWRCPR